MRLFFDRSKWSETDGIGWRVEWDAYKKTLEESKGKIVVANGLYLVRKLHDLNSKEEGLLHAVIAEFRERAGEEELSKENVSKRLRELLREACEEHGLLVDKERGEKIIEIAEANTLGYGVLDPLLEDDSIEEISVIGANKPVYVYRRENGWLKTNCYFTTDEFAVNLINKMARQLGRRITFQNPRLNATLPDGSRLHASISPVSIEGVELTIRKFKKKPFTPADLVSNNTMNSELCALLSLALFGDASLIIAGNTSSGKTTTLNALFSFIPLSDRVVITEETPEISIPHEHRVRVVANEEAGVTMKDLVKDTLRMRPDRVVIGEVRSREEVDALFDSLLSGQARGSYATFHAGSAQETISRLKALGATEGDIGAIDLILVQRRLLVKGNSKNALEIRRVTEFCELEGSSPRTIFSYDHSKDKLNSRIQGSELFERIADTHKLSKKELSAELNKRSKRIAQAAREKLSYEEFTKIAQGW